MATKLCKMEGECFARSGKRCQVLSDASGYNNRWSPCPFQKKQREVTKGRLYPFDPYYSKN